MILNRCLVNKNDLLEEAAIGSFSDVIHWNRGIHLYIGHSFFILKKSFKPALTLMIARQILTHTLYIEKCKGACNTYLLKRKLLLKILKIEQVLYRLS